MTDTLAPQGKVLSFPICKVDEERGEVWGNATVETLDQQGEIVSYDASTKAFDKWCSMFEEQTGGESMGNLREMHQPISVGKVIARVDDPKNKAIYVGARVNRNTAAGRDAWQKVLSKELTGFSIGAPKAVREMRYDKNAGRMVPTVTDYDLAELSLVDNPACPGSFFESIKLTKGAKPTDVIERFENVEESSHELAVGLYREAAAVLDKVAKGNALHTNHKERTMEVEKAGKKIGPQHHEVADAPGTQKPEVPVVQSPDAAPGKPTKTAGGGVTGDDQGESVSAPSEMQGKAAGDMPQPPPQHQAPPPEAPMHQAAPAMQPPVPQAPPTDASQYAFCAYCGKGMGEKSASPFHGTCKENVEMRSAMSKFAGAGDASGLAKLFRAQADALDSMSKSFSTAIQKIEGLEKKITTLEAQPAGGGPARTELPRGVVSVEKGGSAGGANGMTTADAIEKAAAATDDPWLKDKLLRMNGGPAHSMMKDALGRRS